MAAAGEGDGPRRRVLDVADMGAWERSIAYARLMGFINCVNESLKGVSQKDYEAERDADAEGAGILGRLVGCLEELSALVDEIPPVDQPARFGNKAYVTWYERMVEAVPEMVARIAPAADDDVRVELGAFLEGSFGNCGRRDYGTGHELSFIAFLAALHAMGEITESMHCGVALWVFGAAYLDLVRKLQLTYMLEPAGSRGAFGLDDYQFMPFLWGSAQLIGHDRIKPKSVIKTDIIECFAQDYMYIAAIKFICSIKSGPFAEHSSCLFSITNVIHWRKINGGMIKMFKGEVLSKFPVIQHFVFGKIMSFDPATPSAAPTPPTLSRPAPTSQIE